MKSATIENLLNFFGLLVSSKSFIIFQISLPLGRMRAPVRVS